MKSEKQAHILNAAESLFNRFGIKKTGVDEIARQARVAKGTLYNYFGNKEGIIRELLATKLSHFEETINNAMSTISDPVEQVKIIIMERIKLFLKNPFISDTSLQLDDHSTHLFQEDLDRKEVSLLESVIHQARNEGKLGNNEKQVTDTILFTIKGIEQHIKSGFESVSLERIEKDIDYLVTLFFPDKPGKR